MATPPRDDAEQTVMKSLDALREELTEAEAMIGGTRNEEGVMKILRVVRGHNRILKHLVRRCGEADMKVFDQ